MERRGRRQKRKFACGDQSQRWTFDKLQLKLEKLAASIKKRGTVDMAWCVSFNEKAKELLDHLCSDFGHYTRRYTIKQEMDDQEANRHRH